MSLLLNSLCLYAHGRIYEAVFLRGLQRSNYFAYGKNHFKHGLEHHVQCWPGTDVAPDALSRVWGGISQPSDLKGLH